jgi:hypothetical protein
MLDANHGYAIPHVVAFFHGEECGSIHAGALFTKYVVHPIVMFSTWWNSTSFLDIFLVIMFQLNIRCYAGFWNSLQVHMSWPRHSIGQDRSTE